MKRLLNEVVYPKREAGLWVNKVQVAYKNMLLFLRSRIGGVIHAKVVMSTLRTSDDSENDGSQFSVDVRQNRLSGIGGARQ